MRLEQAIRNVIATETFAAYFYEQLASFTQDKQARGFFRKMAAQERRHGREIQDLADRLADGEIPDVPDVDVTKIETSDSWAKPGEITYARALEIALDTEMSALAYYRGLADQLRGEVLAFFKRQADLEEEHVAIVRTLIERMNRVEADVTLELELMPDEPPAGPTGPSQPARDRVSGAR